MKRSYSDIPAFYYPEKVDIGDVILLSQEESRHARVLRLRTNDSLLLLDGDGGRVQACVRNWVDQRISLEIIGLALDGEESGQYIGLVVGMLADRSRMEWLIEKSVELGVREVFPLLSERSEGRFNGKRAEKIAISALKQSQRSWLPTLHEPIDWDGLVGEATRYDRVLFCHEAASEDQRVRKVLEHDEKHRKTLVLIGPEGGFSENEFQFAHNQLNAQIVSLGSTRLRSETAALATITIVRYGL